MASLRHSNVIMFKESFFDIAKEELYLVMEHLNFDTLDSAIKARLSVNE